MSKRICVCSFIVGGLLVLLAALLVVSVSPTSETLSAAQRLRLERVVSEAEGCLTCHDASVQAGDSHVESVSLVVEYVQRASQPVVNLRHAPSRTTSPRVPVVVQADVRAIGQRILDLSDHDSLPLEPVAADFLAAYDTLQSADSAETVVGALETLAQIDELLRTFENQTQPLKWNAPSVPDQSPDVLAAVLVSQAAPSSVALSGQQSVVLMCGQSCGRALIDSALALTPVVMYDVQRRGPPAAFDNINGLGGRLPFRMVVDAQSSLFFAAFG